LRINFKVKLSHSENLVNQFAVELGINFTASPTSLIVSVGYYVVSGYSIV